MRLYRFLLAALLVFFAFQPPLVLADGFGPFPVRNFQPIHQLVLSMPGDRAAVLKQGVLDFRLELAQTASVFNDQGSGATATMKFETMRSGMFLRYGMAERWELSLEVPVLYRSRGFMEGAIKAVEGATSGVAPDRTELEQVSYVFNLSRGGRTIASGREGVVGLGDSTVTSKYQLLLETAWMPAVSVRTALKLPTGNAGQYYGSGNPDMGFGLAVEKGFADRWMLYVNLNGVVPTGRIAGLALNPTISSLIAVEYLWSENFSLTAHFNYYSSPFRGVGTRALDQAVTESVAGFSYRLTQHLLWQGYAVENLDFITGSAADVTVSTLLTYRYDP
ncbi:MAG: DUF3187 family protein [Nitrospira sp.]|nr:DUF3187 family protein [Nitrospira sp.]TKB71570.1 MAG: DUF3187 family protein [Nitrospira sp.]